MSSSEIKDMLVEQLADNNIETKASDWKRTKKVTLKPSGEKLRVFDNAKEKIQVGVTSHDEEDDEDVSFFYGGDLQYAVMLSPEGVVVMFNTSGNVRVYGEGMIDQHIGHILKEIYDIPVWIIEDEVSENTFIVNSKTEQDIDDALSSIATKISMPSYG